VCSSDLNATPLGMYPKIDDSPIDMADAFHDRHIVFDLVYNPIETKFLRLAASKGAQTIGGLTMLLHQAAKSFELWTSQQMPIDVIRPLVMETFQQH
jgi:shikimate dehydrogenase